jgi:hypothetical protein
VVELVALGGLRTRLFRTLVVHAESNVINEDWE